MKKKVEVDKKGWKIEKKCWNSVLKNVEIFHFFTQERLKPHPIMLKNRKNQHFFLKFHLFWKSQFFDFFFWLNIMLKFFSTFWDTQFNLFFTLPRKGDTFSKKVENREKRLRLIKKVKIWRKRLKSSFKKCWNFSFFYPG